MTGTLESLESDPFGIAVEDAWDRDKAPPIDASPVVPNTSLSEIDRCRFAEDVLAEATRVANRWSGRHQPYDFSIHNSNTFIGQVIRGAGGYGGRVWYPAAVDGALAFDTED